MKLESLYWSEFRQVDSLGKLTQAPNHCRMASVSAITIRNTLFTRIFSGCPPLSWC
jgi:hypothetical protein